MGAKQWLESQRLEIIVAVLIALVSLTTALAAWRTNTVSSSAADANRQGLIDALKQGAAQNEDWRKVYEEAGYARDFVVASAAVDAMEASGDESLEMAASTQRQYLLPGMQVVAEPLSTDEKYLKPDGTFDLQKRFNDLETASPGLNALDPKSSFELADQYSSEQRWLTVGTILLVICLFWFGMAEMTRERTRLINLIVGFCLYVFGIIFLLAVEIISILARGGVL